LLIELKACCRDCHFYCYRNYEEVIARRVCPQLRKYDFDQRIVRLGRTYNGRGFPISGTAEELAKKEESYGLVRVGPIIIVQARVDEPGAVPRQALYRDGYARAPHLFADLSDDRWGERPVFAVMTYVPEASGPGLVSAIIGFPDRDDRTFLDTIDLFARFPDLRDGDDGSAVRGPDAPAPVAPMEVVPEHVDLPLRQPNKTGDA
jgi:hypothetical protein